MELRVSRLWQNGKMWRRGHWARLDMNYNAAKPIYNNAHRLHKIFKKHDVFAVTLRTKHVSECFCYSYSAPKNWPHLLFKLNPAIATMKNLVFVKVKS